METANTSTYLTSLTQAGLTYSQAEVYEILIKNGPLRASKIHNKSDLKRSLVYKVLGELLEMDLVTKDEPPRKVAIFSPRHPAKLKDLAEKAEDRAKTAQIVLGGILGQMSSDFNLAVGKPGVQFYEGKEGIIKIYETLLGQKQNIDSFEDKGEMVEFLGNYTKTFTKKRIQNKIFNRVIAPSENLEKLILFP